ncbi:MAG: hydrogenase maturation protease [Chroococcales cyanobacterium]
MMILLIGYGNDLRSDDGVGRQIADILSESNLPDLKTLSVHQLTPELSETLSEVDAAIFVDASANPLTEVTITPIKPLNSDFTLTHGWNPRSLLTLAQTLYGKSPNSWLVEIPAEDFSLGENLSAIAEKGMIQALDRISLLIQEEILKNVSLL